MIGVSVSKSSKKEDFFSVDFFRVGGLRMDFLLQAFGGIFSVGAHVFFSF